MIALIATLAGVAFCIWRILRHAPLEEGSSSPLDLMDHPDVPCPPEHGPHCTCTWRD